MSNSTYCEDHYEQPDWMKKIQGLEKQTKELKELLAKKGKESIDKEKIRKEVERLRSLHQMKYQQLDADNSMSLVECGKRNLCNELLSFIDSLQEEQKPAWSEEDKNHVKSILSTIECCKAQFSNAQAIIEAYNADIDWLKSLGDRVKDNELTWEDIRDIFDLYDEVTSMDCCSDIYGDVLKRFKEMKKK